MRILDRQIYLLSDTYRPKSSEASPECGAHTDTLYAAALAGLGITGLPSFVAEDAMLEHALERVLPRWHLFMTTIYAGLPTRKHIPARMRVFIGFLVQVFGGEDCDPWLQAAGCETLPSTPLPQRRRMGATG